MTSAPAVNLPRVVLALAAALILAHVGRQFLSEEADWRLVLTFAFIPARYGEAAGMLPGGRPADLWTPLTYAFLHADAAHLIVNLVWMAGFGAALARRFGAPRFLALSFLAAAAGAAAHYLAYAGSETIVVGASGAVSGMTAGAARFAFSPGGPLAGGRGAPAYRLPLEPLRVVLADRRALGFIGLWFVANLLFGLVGGAALGATGPIAWEAHVGGFMAGFLLFPLFDPVGPAGRSANELESGGGEA